MFSHKARPDRTDTRKQAGFTLVELVVTITITLILATTFYTFFRTSFFSYLNLQKDASGLTGLSIQTQRIGSVVRGATDIVSAADSDLVVYAYFYPTDTYVSLVHYYLSSNARTLYADVTPMTANPPIGSPDASREKTYTVIDNFQQTSGVTLFNYLDSSGAVLAMPINDLRTIKGIRINLAVATSSTKTSNETITLDVNLRNRKTNL